MPRVYPTLRYRFNVKYEPDENGCWLWTASRGRHGYGQIKVDGRVAKAHRVAWELYRGPIPEGPGHHGTCVLHRCDVRACGELHTSTRMTANDVREIRRRWPGETQTALGREFGISQAAISYIIRRESWAHVV